MRRLQLQAKEDSSDGKIAREKGHFDLCRSLQNQGWAEVAKFTSRFQKCPDFNLAHCRDKDLFANLELVTGFGL